MLSVQISTGLPWRHDSLRKAGPLSKHHPVLDILPLVPAGHATPAGKTLLDTTGSDSHVQGAQEAAGSEGDVGDLEEMQALRDRVLRLQVGSALISPGLQPASNIAAANQTRCLQASMQAAHCM